MKERLKLLLKPIWLGWKHSGHSVCLFMRFMYLNLLDKRIQSHWMKGGVIYLTPYSLIELHKGAILELNAPLVLGSKKFRKSKVETRLLLDKNARMIVNDDSHFGYGSDIEVFPNAILTMDHCGTNYNCTIICGKRIEMHGHVSLGRDVSIRDTNAHFIDIEGYKMLRPVVIENHTWICSGATISAGVKIKEGAVVGAKSYVIQSVPAHSLVSGHPAKVVLRDIEWKL